MSHSPRTYTLAPRRHPEEDRAWYHLYRDCGQVTLAQEIVRHLDADPQTRQLHAALYLRSRETILKHQGRQFRNARIANAIRATWHVLFARPAHGVMNLFRGVGGVAVELLPPPPEEPAVQQVKRIRKTKPFVAAAAEFSNAPAPAPAERVEPTLKPTKAA